MSTMSSVGQKQICHCEHGAYQHKLPLRLCLVLHAAGAYHDLMQRAITTSRMKPAHAEDATIGISILPDFSSSDAVDSVARVNC